MFGFLGLPSVIVDKLRGKPIQKARQLASLTNRFYRAGKYHTYMASNSRISIAGLNEKNVEYVAHPIAKCLKEESRGRLAVERSGSNGQSNWRVSFRLNCFYADSPDY